MTDQTQIVTAEIGSCLKAVRDIVVDAIKSKQAWRKDFYENHLAPIDHLMRQVHDDYSTNLQQAEQIFRDGGSVADAIEYLDKVQFLAKPVRESLKANGRTLLEIDDDRRLRKNVEIVAVVAVAKAIDRYITVSDLSGRGPSWYSTLLLSMRMAEQAGRNPFEESYSGVIAGPADHVASVRRLLSETVRQDLPERWNQFRGAMNKAALVFSGVRMKR